VWKGSSNNFAQSGIIEFRNKDGWQGLKHLKVDDGSEMARNETKGNSHPCDGFGDSTNSEYLIVEAWLSSGISDLRRNSNSVNRHLIKAGI